MKIAIVIGGQPRSWKQTYQKFKKMYGDVNPDIFISTWSTENTTGIIDTYKPKAISFLDPSIIEPKINKRVAFLETLPYHRTGHYSLKTGLLLQHYIINKAFSLIDNYLDYDLIVRYRFDWEPEFIIDWQQIYNLCKERNILLYSNKKVHGPKGSKYTINDLFAIGLPEHMKIYFSLYTAMSYDTYLPCVELTKCFIPEYIMALHLNSFNVKTLGYSFPYTFKNRHYL